MIKIEIKSATATPRQITSRNTGEVITFHEQEAWAFTFDQQGKPHPYPQRIVLNIDMANGQQVYQPGIYQLAPESIYINRFAALEIGRAKLVPIVSASKAA